MASQKYNILYGRLSQEDERQRDDRQKESNSIHNQKLFLEQYAADHGFENTLFLADDGYSGTNFDRPAWKKVIEMVERDEVETIIVKDLSRLGREYLQVGQYTEIYFPEKGVRFIAVNDGVDSLVESSNDFNPIRNWANELHAKDTSTIDELTPELLRLFIQRIEVGERSQKYSRSAGQSVRIVYRDIGRVDSPMQEGEHIPYITKQITDIEEIKRLLA